MPTTHVDGIDIFYESEGAGDPLLLIAGFGCDHTIWAKVAPDLAARYRVIGFDNRGVGQSSGVGTVTSIRDMAADTAAFMDALGLAKAHVVGHSMGGMIAQELALSEPQRVQTLTLLSTTAQPDERGKAIIQAWGALPRLVDRETVTRLILPWIYTSAFYARPGAIEQVVKLVLANPFPTSPATLQLQSRAIAAFHSADRLGQIACPTLVAVGDKDILSPIASGQRLANGIPGAQFTVLPGTGHGLLIESPEAVSEVMLEFLT